VGEKIISKLACAGAIKRSDVELKDMKGKSFPKHLQYAKSANGCGQIQRDWLMCSQHCKAIYWIPCLKLYKYLEYQSGLKQART